MEERNAKEVEEIFLPWINDNVVEELDRVALSRKLTTKVLEAAVQLGQEQAAAGERTLNATRLAEEASAESAYAKLAAIEAKAAEEAAAAAESVEDSEAGKEEEA